MNTQEVANRLVELCRQGQFAEAFEELYADDVISCEPKGFPMERIEGKEAVRLKEKQFNDSVQEFHGIEVSDPIVAENFFAVTMNMDVTFKESPRMNMEEVCVYNVKNGKISQEEFFFTLQG